jgi:hypothetical protein
MVFNSAATIYTFNIQVETKPLKPVLVDPGQVLSENPGFHGLHPVRIVVCSPFSQHFNGNHMSDNDFSKEEQILQMMRKVLTDVAKDTYTKPGLKHPLSEETILSIRECLKLISAREGELAEAAGRPSEKRPRYVDEPQKSVVVKLDTSGLKKKTDSKPGKN